MSGKRLRRRGVLVAAAATTGLLTGCATKPQRPPRSLPGRSMPGHEATGADDFESVQLREAQLGDATEIARCYEALRAEQRREVPYGVGKATEAELCAVLRKYETRPEWIFLVAESHEGLVGLVDVVSAGGVGFVVTLWVDSDWRGHGIGTALLEDAVAWAESRSAIERLELTVFTHNEAAVRLYQKAGFANAGARRLFARSPVGDLYDQRVVIEV